MVCDCGKCAGIALGHQGTKGVLDSYMCTLEARDVLGQLFTGPKREYLDSCVLSTVGVLRQLCIGTAMCTWP